MTLKVGGIFITESLPGTKDETLIYWWPYKMAIELNGTALYCFTLFFILIVSGVGLAQQSRLM